MCVSDKGNPYRMWKRRQDRYAVYNVVIQLPKKLSKYSYDGQVMYDLIDEFEEVFNRVQAMGSPVSEDLQVAMFLASFGDKSNSPYGHVVSTFQTMESSLSRETVTVRFLQDF